MIARDDAAPPFPPSATDADPHDTAPPPGPLPRTPTHMLELLFDHARPPPEEAPQHLIVPLEAHPPLVQQQRAQGQRLQADGHPQRSTSHRMQPWRRGGGRWRVEGSWHRQAPGMAPWPLPRHCSGAHPPPSPPGPAAAESTALLRCGPPGPAAAAAAGPCQACPAHTCKASVMTVHSRLPSITMLGLVSVPH
jgi:hypothetical protein